MCRKSNRQKSVIRECSDFFKSKEKDFYLPYKDGLTEGYVPAKFVDLNSETKLRSGTRSHLNKYCEYTDNTFFESSNFNIIEIDKAENVLTKNKGDSAIYLLTNGKLQIINFSVY